MLERDTLRDPAVRVSLPAAREARRSAREQTRIRRRDQAFGPGKTAKRGYGWAHQKLRARLALEVAAGGVMCARCGELIAPAEPWDLGHDDSDRSQYSGPEHQRCNRATAGRSASRHSREW